MHWESLRDRQTGFEVRLLEADGSATVALNPIAMYVVITNNSSGPDLQQHVWLLPHRVRSVKEVKLDGSEPRIRAEVDADPENPSKVANRQWNLGYDCSGGVLADALTITEQPPR